MKEQITVDYATLDEILLTIEKLKCDIHAIDVYKRQGLEEVYVTRMENAKEEIEDAVKKLSKMVFNY